VPAPAQAQAAPSNPFLLEEHAVVRVSEHVYMIPCKARPGVPNVGIIVGDRATMIFDTGMGRESGAIAVREAQHLSKPGATLYLSTTDLRPEHITGAQSLPPGSIWIVPEAQREEIRQGTMDYVTRFRAMSADLTAILQGLALPEPTVAVDRDATIDLGGVKVRMLWFGPAITRGDALLFVEGDAVLLSGNIVHSRAFLGFPGAYASVTNWLDIFDKLEALHPKIVVPNHADVRDPSIIPEERGLLRSLQARTRQVKTQGMSAQEAGALLKTEFQAKYPAWTDMAQVPNIVRHFYAEAP
jgi:glyoxylase-like metal-dependent hydrolase (beta-lactamase superfamily II)